METVQGYVILKAATFETGHGFALGHNPGAPSSFVTCLLYTSLTKRQLVCFSSAAAVGLPAYLFSRGSIGNSAAMFLMLSLIHI